MIKRIDFIIYYEHVAREWKSVNRLKEELNKLGLKGVVLPMHFNKYLGLVTYIPKIIIVPYLYSVNNDQHLMYESIYGDISILNLHSEQLHDETTKSFQMPHDDYAAKAHHIAWGTVFSAALIEAGVDEDIIYVTGSIRNDDSYCEALSYKKQEDLDYEERILIPTAFSKTFVSKDYINKLVNLAAIDKELYLEKLKYTTRVRDKFFKDILKVSLLNPKKLFSFRPHPYVELNDYIQVFLDINNIKKLPKNIKVQRQGSIQDEILTSDKVITWYSSTALDAYLLKKNVVVYDPVSVPNYMKIGFLRYFPVADSLIALNEFIISKESHTKSNRQTEKYVESVYGAIDGKSSFRVANVIADILVKEGNKLPHNEFKCFKYFLYCFKALVIDGVKYTLLKLNLLHRFKPFYRGILEDHKSNKLLK